MCVLEARSAPSGWETSSRFCPCAERSFFHLLGQDAPSQGLMTTEDSRGARLPLRVFNSELVVTHHVPGKQAEQGRQQVSAHAVSTLPLPPGPAPC